MRIFDESGEVPGDITSLLSSAQPPTLQTARNLEKFVLEFIESVTHTRCTSVTTLAIISSVFADYHREVERRKAEALKYAGPADRRKTPRVTNFEHVTIVSEEKETK